MTRLINAGSVSTEGVELDYALQATQQLKLSGALAYTRARIDQFACPPGAAATCNVNGKPLPFSPDWKSYVRADYSIPLDNGLDIELEGQFTDVARLPITNRLIGRLVERLVGDRSRTRCRPRRPS